jgi:hypothetical protein
MNPTKGEHVVSCMRKPKRRAFAYRFMRYGTCRIDHTRGGLGVYKYIYIYIIYILYIYIYIIYIYWTRQANACASQSRGCTHVGAGARQDIARARGGGGEHTSGGSRPSTRPPTKQHKRLADARAAGANGQPARGRHAPRCASADARSAGRGSGLPALPRPSQCRPEKGPV